MSAEMAQNDKCFLTKIMIVLNFCVHLFIMHHKLIRFKTSFIIDAMIELET